MAIVFNRRMSSKAKATLSQEGRIGREYNQKRLVVTDIETTEYALGTALGYLLGEAHPDDPRALLVDYELDRRERTRPPHCVFDVSLRWSTFGPPTANNTDDPLQQRVKRDFKNREHTFYVFKDRNGNMILNGAKQPFEGGIPVTLNLPTYTYVRNEAVFSGTYATTWSNAINSDTFNGCAPKTLRMIVDAAEQYESDSVFWPVTYQMAYLPIGWQPLPLNAGLQFLSSGKLKPCLDDNLNPVTSPVPLSTAGAQLTIASLPASANFIEVDWFVQQPFSSLGLAQFT